MVAKRSPKPKARVRFPHDLPIIKRLTIAVVNRKITTSITHVPASAGNVDETYSVCWEHAVGKTEEGGSSPPGC